MITWLLKSLFWALDGILRTIIHLVYGLIMKIASASVFQNYIFIFMDRIYTFLAIFMLFKLSISMVNYILNPDQMTDKSKGFGKLIQNVIIVIALIIMVPQIFDWAYKLQCLILNSGVLNTIITGTASNASTDLVYNTCFKSDSECSYDEDLINDNANLVTYSIMSAFVYSGKSNDDEIVPSDISGSHTAATKGGETCAVTKDGGKFDKYKDASDCLFNYQTLVKGNNTYIFLISTGCLAFVAYVFVVFTFDVSIRVVKLSFLQLIAPIPVISMIDPQSGKSGMFSKWLKECTNTYLSLFVRLAAVYFAVELIKQLIDSKICNNSLVVRVAIILGILAFVKQLPQLIQNITGIDMKGDGLSLKKRLSNVPGLNRAAAGAIGLGGGMAANAIASGKNLWGMRKDGFKAIAKGALSGVGSVIGGAGSGAFRGLTSREKNAWKAGQGAIKGAVDKRNLRDLREANGEKTIRQKIQGGLNRTGTNISNWAGIESGATKFDNQIAAYDNFLKQQGELDTFIESEIMKGKGRDKTSFEWTDIDGNTFRSSGNVNVLKNQIESLKAKGEDARVITNAEKAYKAALKQSKIDYFDDHKTDVSTVKAAISEMEYIISNNSESAGFDTLKVNSGIEWDESKTIINTAKNDLHITDEYRRAQINKKNEQKK